MPMFVVHQYLLEDLDTFESFDTIAVMSTDVAFQFGFEDATEGNDQCGSQFFAFGSNEWDAYNEGYLAGLESMAPMVSAERLRAAEYMVQKATSMVLPLLWSVEVRNG